MSGYYQLSRGWLKHPVFGTDPLCRRAAWAWLIEEAAWKETRVGFGGKSVVLKRGQLSHSLRHIAEAWRWKKDAVARYITRLETETMIETGTATGQLVITIINYDTYQAEPKSSETPTAPKIETPPRQDRDRTATTLKEDNNSSTAAAATKPAWMSVGMHVIENILGVKDDPTWMGDARPAGAWLEWGADPETEIYPTVRRVLARYLQRGQGPPGHLNYFDKAISEAIALRSRPQPEVQHANRPRQAKPTAEQRLTDQLRELDILRTDQAGPLESFGDIAGGIIIDQPSASH